ncbi:MAG: polysaccharide deacetylase family protein [Pirellulales bacterium]
MPRHWFAFVTVAALTISTSGPSPAAEPSSAIGTTRVAQWRDDRRAPLVLMFDDSMPSHVQTVLPELAKRKLVGEFYINAGSGHFKAHKEAWENDFTKAGMVLANHTFTHKGAADVADCEREITQCNDVLDAIAAKQGAKPTLWAFGRPGVPKGKWNVTDPELETLLAKHRLVRRPNVLFAQIHMKDGPAMIARVEKALASGKPDAVAFHGVGGEWLKIDVPAFLALLDFIDTKRDQLWVTDTISIHKYQTERDGAMVKVGEADAERIQITLKTKADPKVYDLPLTLVTQVPAAWKRVEVAQGAAKAIIETRDGLAVYEARPDGKPIVLRPAP